MSDGLQVMRCSFRSGRFLLNTQMKSVCVTGLETESTLERRAPSGGHYRALQGWPRTKNPFTCVVFLRRLPGATPSRPADSCPASVSCAEPLRCSSPRRAAHAVPLRREWGDATEE